MILVRYVQAIVDMDMPEAQSMSLAERYSIRRARNARLYCSEHAPMWRLEFL